MQLRSRTGWQNSTWQRKSPIDERTQNQTSMEVPLELFSSPFVPIFCLSREYMRDYSCEENVVLEQCSTGSFQGGVGLEGDEAEGVGCWVYCGCSSL